jgi:hypothetical protein
MQCLHDGVEFIYCKIVRGFCGGVIKNSSLLGHDALPSKWFQTFKRKTLPSSSRVQDEDKDITFLRNVRKQ